MSIQQRRTDKGWAQEELALHSGLSVRTIQRIEAGNRASLESLKCLAAVFETSVSELIQEQNMIDTLVTREPVTAQSELSAVQNTRAQQMVEAELEKNAIAFVQNVKAFHMNWIAFALIMPMLAILNYVLSPQFWWSAIVALAWGMAIILHVIVINKLFGSDWEQREFMKLIGPRN